ncbi:glycosyltransferase family 39 protein [Candidatus Curtissbacteria bacterium]|nr:glycosyltransferase family 39 protein [Candidatus Curtissbacteria bacterium]
MRKIFTEKDTPFIGPTASVGGFFLGPIYYWMAAPFLFIARYDPVGPAYMVAIFGVATVFLLFKFLKEIAGFYPAMLAAFLYSTAPLIVRYSRSSWNPNPMPFFSLLLFYFLYLAISRKNYKLLFVSGLAFGFAIQLHYLSIILVPISGLIALICIPPRKWAISAIAAVLGFLVPFSPFLFFEIKNNFPNFRTIIEFVSRDANSGFKSLNPYWIFIDIGNIFFEAISKVEKTLYTRAAFIILVFATLSSLVINLKSVEKRTPLIIAIVWLLGGLAGLRFYTGAVYDYYFGFLFPAPFFLYGLTLGHFFWDRTYLKTAAIALTIFLIFVFQKNAYYKTPPNRLILQTSEIANLVIEKSEGKEYNFGLISESNSDHAYRYFLEVKHKKPKELEEIVTDQLLVVCESKVCQPLGHPVWEIAGFGRAEVTGEWFFEKYGIKVFKLEHWPGAPSPAGKPAIKGA